ncbi:hypothetical protein PTKIN_Ptkin16aG0495600 [Pterospermum kingtungense]
MDESLKMASMEGNVSKLYRLIQEDRNILKRIDKEEFIDTPLHIAADAGCIDFAIEIMNLKPSFARKLNEQGFSPIHLALEKGHEKLALLLLEKDKDVVRVKGRNGETPLHYAITIKRSRSLLAKFLKARPECIGDVTTTNQNALHIATTNDNFEALKLLCRRLLNTDYCEDVVNQKDRNDNTALHIAARDNRHQMIRLLLKCKADKHLTNQDNLTALGVARRLNNGQSITILDDFFITPSVSAFVYERKKKIVKRVEKASSAIFHDMDNISSDDRNALLVILALLLGATFQTVLSPPGGVYQSDSSSANSTITDETTAPGTSVMPDIRFLLFYIPSYVVFIVTFFLTLCLLKPFPSGFRSAVQVLLAFLAISFDEAISFIAPTVYAYRVIHIFSIVVFALMLLMCISYRVSKISVSIIGCWLYPMLPIDFVGNAVLGFLLFLFLYDEFWQGSVLVAAYCLLISFGDRVIIQEPITLVGSWLFFNLLRLYVNGGPDHFIAHIVHVPSRLMHIWR